MFGSLADDWPNQIQAARNAVRTAVSSRSGSNGFSITPTAFNVAACSSARSAPVNISTGELSPHLVDKTDAKVVNRDAVDRTLGASTNPKAHFRLPW